MHKRMTEWITTGEIALPFFVFPFAKAAPSGGGDDDGDDDDDDDDDEDDDDDLEDLTDEQLREQLKAARDSLSKAGGSVKSKRDKIKKLSRELDEARKPKPAKKPKDDDDADAPDLDSIRHEAKTEGEKSGLARAKRAEAKSALLGAGVNPARVARAVGLLDLDELDLDDDGLDGVEDAIEDLRKEWPELFAKKRQKRESVAGDNDRNGDGAGERKSGRTTKNASELAAAKLLGTAR